jgi:hypothetical protein
MTLFTSDIALLSGKNGARSNTSLESIATYSLLCLYLNCLFLLRS